MEITKQNFRSQFLSFTNPDLQWNGCTPSAISMGLNQLGKSQEPEQVLADLVKMHQNKGEVIKRELEINGEKLNVTVGPVTEVDQLELRKENDTQVTEAGPYIPAFSLLNGYDHRASKEYFSKFDLKTYFIEDYTFNDLVRDLETNRYQIILASIHSLQTRENHIVIPTSVGSDAKGRYIEFVDPAEKEYEFAVKRQDFKFFEFIFNHRATVIL